jgi:DNA-binding response OmpR family regulator
VSTTTVFLVGTDDLPKIPDYLRLGAVVVVAPDRDALHAFRWESVHDRVEEAGVERAGVVVDLAARRIRTEAGDLPVSDLEFRVLSALLCHPGRAWSFRDLRLAGWGDGPALTADADAVRALIQRVRGKLVASGAPMRIEAVRGYGFRVVDAAPEAAPLQLSPGIGA